VFDPSNATHSCGSSLCTPHTSGQPTANLWNQKIANCKKVQINQRNLGQIKKLKSETLILENGKLTPRKDSEVEDSVVLARHGDDGCRSALRLSTVTDLQWGAAMWLWPSSCLRSSELRQGEWRTGRWPNHYVPAARSALQLSLTAVNEQHRSLPHQRLWVGPAVIFRCQLVENASLLDSAKTNSSRGIVWLKREVVVFQTLRSKLMVLENFMLFMLNPHYFSYAGSYALVNRIVYLD
jgi:hypothetical protein